MSLECKYLTSVLVTSNKLCAGHWHYAMLRVIVELIQISDCVFSLVGKMKKPAQTT